MIRRHRHHTVLLVVIWTYLSQCSSVFVVKYQVDYLPLIWVTAIAIFYKPIYAYFYKQFFQLFSRFFLSPCCLTLQWIEPQIFPKCCLLLTVVIILRHDKFWIFCLCLHLGQFMIHLCDLFFISFSLRLIM